MSNSLPENELTFEQALAMLEQIVRKLETGQLGLTQSLAEYETGVRLLKESYAALEQAERRIEQLSGFDAAGNPVTTPFDDAQLSLEKKAGARSQRRTARARPQATSPQPDVDDSPELF